RKDTFASVAEEYIEGHVRPPRSHRATEARIRKELIPRWGDRPAAEIARGDALELARSIRRKSEARKALAAVSHMFNWMLVLDAWGIESNPVNRGLAKMLKLAAAVRDRVLND